MHTTIYVFHRLIGFKTRKKIVHYNHCQIAHYKLTDFKSVSHADGQDTLPSSHLDGQPRVPLALGTGYGLDRPSPLPVAVHSLVGGGVMLVHTRHVGGATTKHVV